MFERFTDRARHVMVLSQEEAKACSHNVIGTEHLLFGVVAETKGLAGEILSELSVTENVIRAALQDLNLTSSPAPSNPPFTQNAKKSLENALRQALAMGHSYIGTEHILLGLTKNESFKSSAILSDLGIDIVNLRTLVVSRMEASTPRGPLGTSRNLLDVVKETGRVLHPNLDDLVFNAKATEITTALLNDIKNMWNNIDV